MLLAIKVGTLARAFKLVDIERGSIIVGIGNVKESLDLLTVLFQNKAELYLEDIQENNKPLFYVLAILVTLLNGVLIIGAGEIIKGIISYFR